MTKYQNRSDLNFEKRFDMWYIGTHTQYTFVSFLNYHYLQKCTVNQQDFKADFLEKERLTFEEDSKSEWREKYAEDRDVEEYKTTTMKELGLTKARSSVINLKKFGSNRSSRSDIVCLGGWPIKLNCQLLGIPFLYFYSHSQELENRSILQIRLQCLARSLNFLISRMSLK